MALLVAGFVGLLMIVAVGKGGELTQPIHQEPQFCGHCIEPRVVVVHHFDRRGVERAEQQALSFPQQVDTRQMELWRQ